MESFKIVQSNITYALLTLNIILETFLNPSGLLRIVINIVTFGYFLYLILFDNSYAIPFPSNVNDRVIKLWRVVEGSLKILLLINIVLLFIDTTNKLLCISTFVVWVTYVLFQVFFHQKHKEQKKK